MGAGKTAINRQRVQMKARTVQLDKKTIFFVMDEFIFLTRTF